MWFSTSAEFKKHLEIEIAQAEAVIFQASDNKTPHEPTISYFRGQADCAKKTLAVIDQMPFGLWLSPMSLAFLAVGGIFIWLLH
jgi:hypothetical protein